MRCGLFTVTGKLIGPLGRLMAGVLVVLLALSLKCFAVNPMPVHDHWHGDETAHHQNEHDKHQQHEANPSASDCCSILESLAFNSLQSFQKLSLPLPSFPIILAVSPVSDMLLVFVKTSFNYSIQAESPPTVFSTMSLSQRAPPMSV